VLALRFIAVAVYGAGWDAKFWWLVQLASGLATDALMGAINGTSWQGEPAPAAPTD
jgi:hypothetical protein